MKFSAACISIALVALAASILPADAADWNNGADGIKDYGHGAIPVPIPESYKDTYKWYLHGSVGLSAKSSGTVSATGAPMAITPEVDQQHMGVFGAGFGRYLTPSLRMQFDFDFRTKQKVVNVDTVNYAANRYSPAANTPSATYNTYSVTRSDDTDISHQSAMVSLAYDIKTGTSLTPYVGAGVGLAVRTLSGGTTENAACTSGPNPLNIPGGTPCLVGLPLNSTYNAINKQTNYVLAASLMAGVTYDVSERTHWDLGYRMMYVGGNTSVSSPSISGTTTLRVDQRVDHEVRTGLRFDIW